MKRRVVWRRIVEFVTAGVSTVTGISKRVALAWGRCSCVHLRLARTALLIGVVSLPLCDLATHCPGENRTSELEAR
jgi:hypothetical protein